ncbi:MAG: hydrogenase small subunit [Desulforhopalus sp.]
MQIHRRSFLKYCVGSAATLGLPMTVLGRLEQALAVEGLVLPKVIWLNGANCTGCTVSLANLFSETGPTDIADLLFNTIDLAFHPTLMGAAGDLAVEQLKATALGSYILAVDGGIPTAFDGHTCMLWTDQGSEVTAMEAVKMLAPKAAAVLAIGTCASSGGMPAGDPNPTGIVSVSELTGVSTVNIPGCPTHPDWIVWTIAHLLSGETPQLDNQNRPIELYGTSIHKNCYRRGQEEAKTFGIEHQCLKELGCKGPETKSDCPSRKWNSGTNWCIGAGAICIGCTEQDFPDKYSPFYKAEYEYKEYQKLSNENENPGDSEQKPSSSTLQFSKAHWDTRSAKLKVEGKGIAGQIVSIYNADTGTLLGAVSVNESGKWKLRYKDPSPVPRRLLAKSGSESVFSELSAKHRSRRKEKFRRSDRD